MSLILTDLFLSTPPRGGTSSFATTSFPFASASSSG